jgi:phenylacetate-CoA ligase
VIDKNTIRSNSDAFISSHYNIEELIPAVTSGSTGTPFKVFHSKDKKLRNTADTIYFARLAGYELGNKLYYLKIWSQQNRKTKLAQYLQNVVPIDVLDLRANVGQIVSELNSNRSGVSILAYVSALETICKELDQSHALNRNIAVNSIVTMSESLNVYTQQAGERLFRCPVLSRYSNLENGIIAQQTMAERTNFIVNRASYFLEILDIEKDERLPNGSLGRIVLTDFFNDAMPMIRYDTGDIGAMGEQEIEGTKQLVLTRLEGRKLDQIFNTDGDLISSYIVYKNMWKYTEIEQYQFIQKGHGEYVFRISIQGKFRRERELVGEFLSYLGRDADFRIEYVNEIPLLSSGKRKKIVNESTDVARHWNN